MFNKLIFNQTKGVTMHTQNAPTTVTVTLTLTQLSALNNVLYNAYTKQTIPDKLVSANLLSGMYVLENAYLAAVQV